MAAAATVAAFAFLAVLALSQHAGAQSCSKKVGGGTYDKCTTLPVLGASLAYTPSADGKGASVAFSATPAASAGWVAWGINLKNPKMVDAQVLLAYRNGSAGATAHLYRLANKSGPFEPVVSLDFRVADLKAAQSSDGRLHIFANVSGLPQSLFNLIWQVGSAMNGASPQMHAMAAENLKSVQAKFSFASSSSAAPPSASPARSPTASTPSPASSSPPPTGSPSGSTKPPGAPSPTNNPAAPSRAGSGALVAATVVLAAVALLLRPASF